MDSLQKTQGKVERLPDTEDTLLAQDQKVREGIQGCNKPVLGRGGAEAGEDGELEVKEDDPEAVKGREPGRNGKYGGGKEPC